MLCNTLGEIYLLGYIALSGSVPGWKFHYSKGHLQKVSEIRSRHKANKISTDDKLKAHFAQSHAAKMIWAYKPRYFINPSFREQLNLLIKLLNSDYQWESTIAFMIPRDPAFVADDDSSLFAAGVDNTAAESWAKKHHTHLSSRKPIYASKLL
eukprot:5529710-Ditylum_brightwellii.AAC.1